MTVYADDWRWRPDARPGMYRDGQAEYRVHFARQSQTVAPQSFNEQLSSASETNTLEVWGIPSHVTPSQGHRIQPLRGGFHWVVTASSENLADGEHVNWVVTALRVDDPAHV